MSLPSKSIKSKSSVNKQASDFSEVNCKVKTQKKIISESELDTSVESSYMPNFAKNFNDLISEIKQRNISNTTLSKSPLMKIEERKNKSELNPFIDHNKLESMITNIQKDDLKSLTNIEEIRDFYDYTENCLKLITTIIKPKLNEIEHMLIELPEKLTIKKKLAVFDLDETLIHCELKKIETADKIIQVKMPSGKEVKIGLNIRPYIKEALTEIQTKYHMIIYTASDQSYADSVLDYLDPFREYFPVRLYRKNCVKANTQNGPVFIKDLRIIKNVKMKDMIIIDNSVLSFAYQLDNGIPILPYYNNKSDIELMFLKDHLLNLSYCEDFRVYNGKIFNLKFLMKNTLEEENKNTVDESIEEDKAEVKYISSSNEDLEKRLNKPVRRDSKFQIALGMTLENAHSQSISQKILNTIKEDNEEIKDDSAKKKRNKDLP